MSAITPRSWCYVTSGRDCPMNPRNCVLWVQGIGCPYIPEGSSRERAARQRAISVRTGRRRGNGKKSIRRGLR
jgi:hypothetical protein